MVDCRTANLSLELLAINLIFESTVLWHTRPISHSVAMLTIKIVIFSKRRIVLDPESKITWQIILTVWVGVWSKTITGTFFIREGKTVDCNPYFRMLAHYILPKKCGEITKAEIKQWGIAKKNVLYKRDIWLVSHISISECSRLIFVLYFQIDE